MILVGKRHPGHRIVVFDPDKKLSPIGIRKGDKRFGNVIADFPYVAGNLAAGRSFQRTFKLPVMTFANLIGDVNPVFKF